MAVIGQGDLTQLRQRAAAIATKLNIPISKWRKANANAAFQAIEDYEVKAHTNRPSNPDPLTRRDAIANQVLSTLTLEEEKILWVAWAEFKVRQLKADLGVG